MHPTIKAQDNLCFPLRMAYLLLLSPTLHKSHGDLHPSFLHFIFWQAQHVGKILVYMANWMCVFMNYYCWHYPWGKTLGGKTISPYLSLFLIKNSIPISIAWVSAIVKDYMIVEYVDLLKRSYVDSFLCYDKLQLLQWLRL